MEFVKKSIAYIFSAFVGALALLASVDLFPLLTGVDTKILVAVITVAGTFITGFVLAILNHNKAKVREMEGHKAISERELHAQKQIREREIEEAHRERKVQIYLEFVQMISSFIQGENPENKKKPLSQQQILNKIETFQNGILLWGGPEVLKAYLHYRTVASQGNKVLFESIDQLYKSIRQDIGLSNQGLDDMETIRLYLKNPSELKLIDDITSADKG
jgi:hypothetical protein